MPVTKAEFEEKTYESYFSRELASHPTFSPGQVAENFLGFDGAFFLPWYIRWPRFGPWHMPGISLRDLDYIAREISDHLPEFRLNFFVQYKRPEFVSGPRGKQRQEWGEAYYRYYINSQQQNTLARLHAFAEGRAAVLYASPAFWESKKLYEFAGKRRVIKNSNLASVEKMTGHGCYTYVAPGNFGKGHSETEDIESPSLENIYANRPENGLPFKKHIIETSRTIKKSMEEQLLQEEFAMAHHALISGFKTKEDSSLEINEFISSLITIHAFCQICNVSLYPVI